MARTAKPDAPELATYVVVSAGLFNHPDGVAAPGETVRLTAEGAARGLTFGQIVPAQHTESSAAQSAGSEE